MLAYHFRRLLTALFILEAGGNETETEQQQSCEFFFHFLSHLLISSFPSLLTHLHEDLDPYLSSTQRREHGDVSFAVWEQSFSGRLHRKGWLFSSRFLLQGGKDYLMLLL